jgi:uncharacterized protein YbjT (DUF2867 family)
MILVVGATGELGSLVVRRLRAVGRRVRAMVRNPAAAQDLADTGAELVTADLRRPETLDAALRGVETVVATANVVAPAGRGDTSAALDEGYRQLITRADRLGVHRFVYSSIPVNPLDRTLSVARTKRWVETLLAESGLSYASLRLGPFTEVWLDLVGSSLPLRGEQRSLVARPYGFLRGYRRLTGELVERHGVMIVPVPASRRHAFISVHDVARLMAAAVDQGTLSGAADIGGPEVLSWSDVAGVFADVLARPVRIVSIPAGVCATLQHTLAPVAPAASCLAGLYRLVAGSSSDWDTSAVTDRMGVRDLRTVEQILREKAALPGPRGG